MLTSNQIREKFLNFFANNKHTQIKSASLIPQNDPTLYFTNAGMVPFKNIFTGEEKRDFTRAATSQKCMRVSGKHNDLENVGRTTRHHTFFEMLGNFSFGDYFKSEAIALAWEFLTEVVKIPKDKLWVTVFETDDEAFAIWEKEQGVPSSRIVRLGEKDNFWSMGETGPCGPCSEIHFQFDSCSPFDPKNIKDWFVQNSDAGHIMEIWNLVFMQYEQQAGGVRTNLPKPSIDTGMGLERITAVLQGVTSNYDTDLFTSLLKEIATLTSKTYQKDTEEGFSMRVLADHIRATVFLIADGVLPSNEGRGYVLRRIMRRAIRHGKLLGQTQPFFYKLTDALVQEMGEAYPEIRTQKNTVEKVIQAEEERFFETLDKGLKILNDEIQNAKGKTLKGEVAFKLYDTYGFPFDLTELIASENGLSVDTEAFEDEMQKQKVRARANWKGTDQEKVSQLYFAIGEKTSTQFLGYDSLRCDAKVLALIQDGKQVDSITQGTANLIVDQTPFYAESGGQVGDQGLVIGCTQSCEAVISDTQKPLAQLFVHSLKLKSGSLKVGDTVQLAVDPSIRQATMRNHSATHLMHAALRKVLGPHVRQAGSLVDHQGLRFDFAHFTAITPEQIQTIENEVNAAILANYHIDKNEMGYDAAVAAGALAFFGDKYGDKVRVLKMGDYSTELCGGTHLDHTAEIGSFKILSESSVAAGVRRIEAITGLAAVQFMQNQAQLIGQISQQLKTAPAEILLRLEKMNETLKVKDREIEKLKSQMLRGSSQDYLKDLIQAPSVKAVYYKAQIEDAKEMQNIGQVILEKLGSGIAVVGAELKGKANLLVMVSKDSTGAHPANVILAPLAELIGGRGGGKADRAQAGGDILTGLDLVHNKLQTILNA